MPVPRSTPASGPVAARYPKATIAEINVELGSTLREGIDAGTTTLVEIK